MMNLRRLQTASSRKRLIVSCLLVVFLILTGSYILWSKQIWSQYTPTYTAWHHDIKSTVDEIVRLPATNVAERAMVNSRLKALSNQISTKQKNICTPHTLVQWQSGLMKSLAQARTACVEKIAPLGEFQKQLTVVMAYNDDDQKLAKIISSVPPANELNESEWLSQPGLWGKTAGAIATLSVSDAFKPTQQQAIKMTTAVKDAWEAVLAAHQVKDKAKYIAAVEALGKSYDGLDQIAVSSEATVAALARTLEDRHQKAF